MSSESWYDLQVDRKQVAAERAKARKLRESGWWRTKLQTGKCHYCEKTVGADALTMDHIVPLARGGKSTRGNIVPACKPCNTQKKLETPAERLINLLKQKE